MVCIGSDNTDSIAVRIFQHLLRACVCCRNVMLRAEFLGSLQVDICGRDDSAVFDFSKLRGMVIGHAARAKHR